MLIARLPDLGTVNWKRLAALVGVAPFNRDSGTFRGTRAVWGGRPEVRTLLYMSTIAAIRCNSVIRTFYQRLRAAGKPAKVAITACMRKLLTILNAMVRTQTMWDENFCKNLHPKLDKEHNCSGVRKLIEPPSRTPEEWHVCSQSTQPPAILNPGG